MNKDEGIIKSLVITWIERLIPVVFVIGLISSIFMAYGVANAWGEFSFKLFFTTLLTYVAYLFASFYFLYLFIDIKDSLNYANKLKEQELRNK